MADNVKIQDLTAPIPSTISSKHSSTSLLLVSTYFGPCANLVFKQLSIGTSA